MRGGRRERRVYRGGSRCREDRKAVTVEYEDANGGARDVCVVEIRQRLRQWVMWQVADSWPLYAVYYIRLVENGGK